jgi:hypothetical protein
MRDAAILAEPPAISLEPPAHPAPKLEYPNGNKHPLPHAFTTANASAMAAKSAKRRAELRQVRETAAQAASLQVLAGPPDPFVTELAQAQAETLQKLRLANDPRDKMNLAKALRDLRETYHMVTGTPKPGMIKPGSARPMPRQLVAPIPTVTPVTPVTAQSGEAMPTMPDQSSQA